jgi:hypothetical protein
MFYIVRKKDTEYYVWEISDVLVTDATYHNILRDEELGIIDIAGQFGRKDYADIWCDYYNNKIDRDILRRKLKI